MNKKQDHEETLRGSSIWDGNENDHGQMRGWFSEPHAGSCLDRVAGQESQFAEFTKNVLLCLSPTKENTLVMYPTFSGVMSPRDPTSKHVRSHMNPLSAMSETRSRYFYILCFLSWALLMFVSKDTVSSTRWNSHVCCKLPYPVSVWKQWHSQVGYLQL